MSLRTDESTPLYTPVPAEYSRRLSPPWGEPDCTARTFEENDVVKKRAWTADRRERQSARAKAWWASDAGIAQRAELSAQEKARWDALPQDEKDRRYRQYAANMMFSIWFVAMESFALGVFIGSLRGAQEEVDDADVGRMGRRDARMGAAAVGVRGHRDHPDDELHQRASDDRLALDDRASQMEAIAQRNCAGGFRRESKLERDVREAIAHAEEVA